MAVIINGKEVAKKTLEILKTKVQNLSDKPKLAVILANDNPSSKIYVNSKEKQALNLGFKSEVFRFDESVKMETITNLIQKLNKDKETNGILVQLPLFSHLDEQKILELIEPIKDVDGFHPINVGRLNCGLEPFAKPCTPKGIIKLLNFYNIDPKGKLALVIGRSNIVGKPIATLLSNLDATVILAHSKTQNLKELSKQADIIVSATGQAGLIKEDMVKKGAIVLDVGITKKEDGKLSGDVDFENVSKIASYITPVPGGIGPMTIASLMENTFELYLKQKEQEG